MLSLSSRSPAAVRMLGYGAGRTRLAEVQEAIWRHFDDWFVLQFGASVADAWPDVAWDYVYALYGPEFRRHAQRLVCPLESVTDASEAVRVRRFMCVGDS